MNEPAEEKPKTPKRSKRKPAMEPLGWDEIVSQPGMGGYLSFLNGPVFLPHLQGAATAPATVPDPEVASAAGAAPALAVDVSSPGAVSRPERVLDAVIDPHSVPITDPVVESSSQGAVTSEAEVGIPRSDPGVVSAPAVKIVHTPIVPTPEVLSIPAIPTVRLRIRRCSETHDGHSLGEEVLYQSLWKAALEESSDARTIVIGWRGMSQLCRMTPKNCKINTQRLIRKLALEVLSPYNTPESIGTTYRVYSDTAVLKRRSEAGLQWVVRSRGVEFVDPTTGLSIMPICAHTHQSAAS